MKKKLLSAVSLVIVLTMLLTGAAINSSATSDDPSDTYVKQIARSEDETLDMWFNHSFVKTARGDNTSTGRDTYSIYMAKNEIESAQMVLASNSSKGHTGLTVSLTDFTDENGNTIPAELYRQFYISISEINTSNYYGASDGNIGVRTDIDQPDAVMTSGENGAFDIESGMTQAFLIRLTTSSDTPSGWYSGQVTVRQHPVSDGKIDLSTYEEVKTATVYAYVWDFEMSEKTELESSVYIAYDGSAAKYQAYYDYLLENRLCGATVPGTLSADNEYVNNPRVSSFCIVNPDNKWAYPASSIPTSAQTKSYYQQFSSADNWDEIKEKVYFYLDDEPMPENHGHHTVDDVQNSYEWVSKAWTDPYVVVPYEYNTAYPSKKGSITETIAALFAKNADIKDSTQEMMDDGSVTIWCPRIYDMTPISELRANGYDGTYASVLKNSDCMLSGNFWLGESYFDWTQKYGDFADRVRTYVAQANASGKPTKLWMYLAGRAGGYTYANHLIENTGLQTKMYMWQTYQEGATGYLYYGANMWRENETTWSSSSGWARTDSFSVTQSEYYYNAKTGARTTSDVTYYVNKLYQNNGVCYGNGVLFYDNVVASKLYRAANGSAKNVAVAGTIRVEILRDGIEDYQMLKMYESLCGEDAAQAIVAKISDNVVNYASLKNFDLTAHGWDEGMTADDAVAAARIELGNAIEAELSSNEPDTPSTEAPETEAPETEAPETEAPATEAPATEAPETEAPAVTTGDVNGDGKVNATDILLIKRSMSGMLTLSNSQLSAADVNGDSKVNATDILLIKRSMAGMINLG